MKRLRYLLALLTLTLTGCYDLQESYDYVPVVSSPYIHMNAWEFIESRQDIFRFLKEAIEYVDENYPGFKDYFTQNERKYTYLFMMDEAFTVSTGVFINCGVNPSVTQDIRDIPVDLLLDALLYHIVDGYYHTLDVSGSLSFMPIHVITLLQTDMGVMTMKMDERTNRSHYSRLRINYNLGTSYIRNAVTSNLIATNGVIHVFDRYLYYKP